MSEALLEEAKSLWSISKNLLEEPERRYDPVKLGHLIDAIRDCAEGNRQRGQVEWADKLAEIAKELASRARPAVSG